MHINIIILFLIKLCSFAAFVKAATCPSGGIIYEWGITEQGKKDAVNIHNNYRRLILNGQVPNQPKGKNIRMVAFDNNLAIEGRKVSQTCKMNHILAGDGRWNWVGQNLFISWSSVNVPGQNWAEAIASWYDEKKNFRYPYHSNGGVTGHYTQLIWATSSFIGCDYISFYDVSQPSYPFAKLYTCNYGPGGNYVGQAPYELA